MTGQDPYQNFPPPQWGTSPYPQPYAAPRRGLGTGAIVALVLAGVFVLGTVGVVALLYVGGRVTHRVVGVTDRSELLSAEATAAPLAADPGGLALDALRQAAIAEEVYAVDHDGRYTADLAAAYANAGIAPDPAVLVRAVAVTESRFCLAARHRSGGPTYYYDAAGARVSQTPCG